MATRIAKATNFIRSSVLGTAAIVALAAAPALANVKDGVDAWSAGDYSRAVAEWQGPAQAGDADALFNLAQAYRLGRGVEADVSRAKQLYAQAAERGHVKAADNYGLLLFQQGEQESAMPYIRSAAERGDPRGQYVLGLAHFNGDFAEKDWVRAYAYLTLAQSAGLPQARNALAQMDEYVPQEQRQDAQVVARQIEASANQRRNAELAAADLGSQSEAAPNPVVTRPKAPARIASTARSAPVRVPQAQRASAATAEPRIPAEKGIWALQLGAFGVKKNADRLWSKLAGNSALAGTDKALVPAGRVTKLKAVGFRTRAEAQSACATLKRQGQNCLVTKG